MSSALALIVFAVGIAGLFYLDRDKSLRTSGALWFPIIWLWIIGSRPVSIWTGINPEFSDVSQAAEGSPVDAIIYGILLACAIVVLAKRKRQLRSSLQASVPCLLYFGYCLLSVVWSDFPGIALKRWIKAIGDLAMVLVVVTDANPEAAFGRFISRAGYVLMPASVLLIKYFGDLGRGYDPDGDPMNTGVTTTKNTLGVIALVICLGALWYFLNALLIKPLRNRPRKLVARGVLLAFSVSVLTMAHSATAIVCFALGAVLLLAAYVPMIGRRPGAVHGLVVFILVSGGVMKVVGGQDEFVHALGKKSDLTGRAEIWAAVLSAVPNPLVGAGFESFWIGPRVDEVYSKLSKYQHVSEAHNGYIEIYVNLGAVGVALIGVILVSSYKGSTSMFRRLPAFGCLLLSYTFAAAFYDISEAGFRTLSPMWMLLLFALVGSHTISARITTSIKRRYAGSRSDLSGGGEPSPIGSSFLGVSQSSRDLIVIRDTSEFRMEILEVSQGSL